MTIFGGLWFEACFTLSHWNWKPTGSFSQRCCSRCSKIHCTNHHPSCVESPSTARGCKQRTINKKTRTTTNYFDPSQSLPGSLQPGTLKPCGVKHFETVCNYRTRGRWTTVTWAVGAGRCWAGLKGTPFGQLSGQRFTTNLYNYILCSQFLQIQRLAINAIYGL